MTANGQSSSETIGCDTESKPVMNKFINDGSFLETFKKMQQEQQLKSQQLNLKALKTEPADGKESINHTNSNQEKELVKKEEQTIINSPNEDLSKSSSSSSSSKVILGKRRNQKLKVGIIKRNRQEIESNDDNQDAWTKYMREVREYKEKYGDDSDKKRPLVK